MEMLIRAICLVGGYGVGLIQTAYIYGRIKGVDIRSMEVEMRERQMH